jgi:hypothetical protein
MAVNDLIWLAQEQPDEQEVFGARKANCRFAVATIVQQLAAQFASSN